MATLALPARLASRSYYRPRCNQYRDRARSGLYRLLTGLVIASNNPRATVDGMRGSLHDLKDQLGVLRAVTKSTMRVNAARDAANAVLGSLALAQTDRPLPVASNSRSMCSTSSPMSCRVASIPVGCRREPDHVAVDEAVKRLSRQADGHLLGGGAVSSAAPNAIASIAEALNAPVITSIQGKGAIPADHPNFAGNAWGAGNALDDLIKQADCMLIFGSRMGAQATYDFTMCFPREVIRVDIDPVELTLNVNPTLAIQADSAAAATAIAAQLKGHEHAEGGYSRQQIADARASAEAASYHAERREWPDAIRAALPRDGILVTDMTQMAYVATATYPVYEPRTFLFPNGYGTLGFSLPAAIGAKIGQPDKAVVSVVGDGGFQYSMGELAVAIQERIGLPIVIFNDNTYSAVKEAQKWERGRRVQRGRPRRKSRLPEAGGCLRHPCSQGHHTWRPDVGDPHRTRSRPADDHRSSDRAVGLARTNIATPTTNETSATARAIQSSAVALYRTVSVVLPVGTVMSI